MLPGLFDSGCWLNVQSGAEIEICVPSASSIVVPVSPDSPAWKPSRGVVIVIVPSVTSMSAVAFMPSSLALIVNVPPEIEMQPLAFISPSTSSSVATPFALMASVVEVMLNVPSEMSISAPA
ncbi:MAG: hypothetical protein LUG52_04540 [Clostridia bacterium]|nr:hypothetical protein [Clostridia bacterium]